jgi:hypothetical protein
MRDRTIVRAVVISALFCVAAGLGGCSWGIQGPPNPGNQRVIDEQSIGRAPAEPTVAVGVPPMGPVVPPNVSTETATGPWWKQHH